MYLNLDLLFNTSRYFYLYEMTSKYYPCKFIMEECKWKCYSDIPKEVLDNLIFLKPKLSGYLN